MSQLAAPRRVTYLNASEGSVKVLWAFSLPGLASIIAAFSSGSRKLCALGESWTHLLTHCKAGHTAPHMSVDTRCEPTKKCTEDVKQMCWVLQDGSLPSLGCDSAAHKPLAA